MRLGAALLVLCCACAPSNESPKNSASSSLDEAIERTMIDAREAIDRHDETSEAMRLIQSALADLAREPGLKDPDGLEGLHGGSAMAATPLASEGDDGITLFVVRFKADSTTRVHDHLAWGVIHVLDGSDRYVEWERLDDGSNSDRADLRKKREVVLQPGQSVYWLSPPQDIHSQESLGSDVWELVIAGKNLTAPIVTQHRHYFDPETSRVESVGP